MKVKDLATKFTTQWAEIGKDGKPVFEGHLEVSEGYEEIENMEVAAYKMIGNPSDEDSKLLVELF